MRFFCFLSLSAAVLWGCAQPPDKEVEMAAARVARAREAGAAHYAPVLLRQAEGAIVDARRNLARRETYLSAVRAASIASLRAEEARVVATQGRRKPTAEAVRLLREAAALIEQARALDRAQRFPREIEGFKSRLASLESALTEGQPEKAREGAHQIKAELLALHQRLKAPQ